MTTITIDMRQFREGSAQAVRNMNRAAEAVMKGVASEFLEQILPATPVDTGFARRNWQATFLAPAVGTVESFDKSPGGRFTVLEQKARIAQYRFGPAIFIVNNVSYVPILNSPATPSRQAPPGFIEATLQRSVRAGLLRIGEFFRAR